MSTWTPPQHIRTVAIGVIRYGDRLLLMAVKERDGLTKGWRPLGGGIDFGERAAAALVREIAEEIGAAIKPPVPLTIVENLFTHNGVAGHEIHFIFTAEFADPAAAARERHDFGDGGVDNVAEWVEIAHFRDGSERLFPEGLLALIDDTV